MYIHSIYGWMDLCFLVLVKHLATLPSLQDAFIMSSAIEIVFIIVALLAEFATVIIVVGRCSRGGLGIVALL